MQHLRGTLTDTAMRRFVVPDGPEHEGPDPTPTPTGHASSFARQIPARLNATHDTANRFHARLQKQRSGLPGDYDNRRAFVRFSPADSVSEIGRASCRERV